jgi:pyrimidine-specific ribonucleoside hydrolase
MSDGRRRPVILDCDPGHDDALAILLAARHFEILGVTAVAGNADVTRTTLNARRVVDLTGLPIPVARGCGRPLAQDPVHAPEIHGPSGLEGYEFPPPQTPVAARHAVDFMIETIRAREGTTVIATGPLTNLAEALRRAPDLPHRIREISFMGGSATVGNVTPVAEFNIWFDPEAADVVFRSGIPLWMCGLNLTHQAWVDEAVIRRFERLSTPAARAMTALLRHYLASARRAAGVATASLHDPCAVAILLERAAISWTPMHVAVELRGELTRGMTVCDARHETAFSAAVSARTLPRGLPPNANVALTLDHGALLDLLDEALAGFPRQRNHGRPEMDPGGGGEAKHP